MSDKTQIINEQSPVLRAIVKIENGKLIIFAIAGSDVHERRILEALRSISLGSNDENDGSLCKTESTK